MNLEIVETLCLNYLSQAGNPLVPLDTLLEFCRRDEQCAGLEEKDLLDFLRHHDQVRIIEAPADVSDMMAAGAPGPVGDTVPRAILKTRVPAQRELALMMAGQLDSMMQALEAAIEQGPAHLPAASLQELRDALVRAKELRSRIDDVF